MKKMKKIVSVWILVMAMIIAPIQYVQPVQANGAITLSGIPESAKIDDTFTVTVAIPDGYMAGLILEYNASVLSYESCSVDATGGSGDLHFNIFSGNSATVTFKAIAEGECTIKVYVNGNIGATDAEANEVDLTEATGKVTVKNEVVEEEEPTKSNDNSLQYIKLSSGTLSPEFKYNIVNYTATVDYSVTSIVVDAKTSNSKATIESVTGYDNLQVGENTITIVVVAENGVKATYRIVVTRLADTENNGGNEGDNGNEGNTGDNGENGEEGKRELNYTYNGQDLSVKNDIPEDLIPVHFKETVTEISGQKIGALKFEKGDVTLLYLENAEGYGNLYVYDAEENDVYPFIKLTGESSYVIVLRPAKDTTMEGYTQCTLSIEGKGTITAFQKTKEIKDGKNDGIWKIFFNPLVCNAAEVNISDFYLMYCINSKGETGWYLYDAVENTFQRYSKDLKNSGVSGSGEFTDEEIADMAATNLALKNKQDRMQMVLYALGIAVAVLLVALIIVTIMGMKSTKIKDIEEEDDFKEEVKNTPYGKLQREEPVRIQYEEQKPGEPKNSPYGKLIPEEAEKRDDFDIEISINDAFPEDEEDYEDEDLEILDV